MWPVWSQADVIYDLKLIDEHSFRAVLNSTVGHNHMQSSPLIKPNHCNISQQELSICSDIKVVFFFNVASTDLGFPNFAAALQVGDLRSTWAENLH